MEDNFIDLVDFIEELKSIKLALGKFNSSHARTCVLYLTKAIASLEDYCQAHQGQYEPKQYSGSLLREWAKEQQKKKQQSSPRSKQFSVIPPSFNTHSWIPEYYRNGKLVKGHWRKKHIKKLN
jgi:hypothetical protein